MIRFNVRHCGQVLPKLCMFETHAAVSIFLKHSRSTEWSQRYGLTRMFSSLKALKQTQHLKPRTRERERRRISIKITSPHVLLPTLLCFFLFQRLDAHTTGQKMTQSVTLSFQCNLGSDFAFIVSQH